MCSMKFKPPSHVLFLSRRQDSKLLTLIEFLLHLYSLSYLSSGNTDYLGNIYDRWSDKFYLITSIENKFTTLQDSKHHSILSLTYDRKFFPDLRHNLSPNNCHPWALTM